MERKRKRKGKERKRKKNKTQKEEEKRLKKCKRKRVKRMNKGSFMGLVEVKKGIKKTIRRICKEKKSEHPRYSLFEQN